MSQDAAKGDDGVQGQGTDANTPPTYKEQLDEAAIKVKNSQSESNEGVISQVVEKGKTHPFQSWEVGARLIDIWPHHPVSQYVPAVGKVLGSNEKEDESSKEDTKIPGPPERPHHDTQIEEFIKDQHRSKTDDGKLA